MTVWNIHSETTAYTDLDSVQVMHRISDNSVEFTFPLNGGHFSYLLQRYIALTLIQYT